MARELPAESGHELAGTTKEILRQLVGRREPFPAPLHPAITARELLSLGATAAPPCRPLPVARSPSAAPQAPGRPQRVLDSPGGHGARTCAAAGAGSCAAVHALKAPTASGRRSWLRPQHVAMPQAVRTSSARRRATAGPPPPVPLTACAGLARSPRPPRRRPAAAASCPTAPWWAAWAWAAASPSCCSSASWWAPAPRRCSSGGVSSAKCASRCALVLRGWAGGTKRTCTAPAPCSSLQLTMCAPTQAHCMHQCANAPPVPAPLLAAAGVP